MNTRILFNRLLFCALVAPLALGMGICARTYADSSVDGAAMAGQYGIAPDDEINVVLVNFPTLSTQTYVPRDGRITLPLIGAVSVIGKTTDEISRELTTQFSVYLVKPIVNVSITLKHSEIVTLGGSVGHQGTIEYKPGIRLVDAIIQAGGPLPTADLSQVSVVHLNGERQTTNITKPASVAGTDVDLVLQEGDAVYVPESTREISVVGQVKAPGSYPYHDDMTVLDAVGDGGGVTDVADLQHSELTSGTTTVQIDLQKALLKGEMEYNLPLHPGDTVTIPLISRTYVFGDVNKPGYYPYQPGDRVLDALNGAGGTTYEANVSKVYVIHMSADNKTAQSTPVNLNRFFKNGDLTGNVLLTPGDVIFVGDKHKAFDWSSIFAAVDTANLATRF